MFFTHEKVITYRKIVVHLHKFWWSLVSYPDLHFNVYLQSIKALYIFLLTVNTSKLTVLPNFKHKQIVQSIESVCDWQKLQASIYLPK